MSKEISIVFHNGFNCGYYFIIKKLTKEVKENFQFQQKKKLQKLIKMEKKLEKTYLTD